MGVVDYFGEKRKVLVNFIDVKVGDFIYAQGGIAVSKISHDEAVKTLETWEEAFFSLKKIDEELSTSAETKNYPASIADRQPDLSEKQKPSSFVLKLSQKINRKKKLTDKELLSIFEVKDKEELKLLFNLANSIRHKERSNACCVHGIIEFSNYCNSNCFYCGIRKDRNIKRYRLSIEEIVKIAEDAVNNLGFRALVLQSGEDDWYTENRLLSLVQEIKKLGVLIMLSIGERDKKTYQNLFDAGARGILLRFETSNREIFNRLRPNTDLDRRVELIKHLKNMGYIVATGFIAGLPGETDRDILNNILLTKSLKPDMVSFGPLIPTKETPLEKQDRISITKALKVIALTRFIDRKATILVTTALETLDKEAKKDGLLSGANSLMINITPTHYRNLYSIYDNRSGIDMDVSESIKETKDLLYSLGRAPVDIGI